MKLAHGGTLSLEKALQLKVWSRLTEAFTRWSCLSSISAQRFLLCTYS